MGGLVFSQVLNVQCTEQVSDVAFVQKVWISP